MIGELKDYIHGGAEVGLLGLIYYLWKKYVKPQQDDMKNEINSLREEKHEALIEKAKLEVKNEFLEEKKPKRK